MTLFDNRSTVANMSDSANKSIASTLSDRDLTGGLLDQSWQERPNPRRIPQQNQSPPHNLPTKSARKKSTRKNFSSKHARKQSTQNSLPEKSARKQSTPNSPPEKSARKQTTQNSPPEKLSPQHNLSERSLPDKYTTKKSPEQQLPDTSDARGKSSEERLPDNPAMKQAIATIEPAIPGYTKECANNNFDAESYILDKYAAKETAIGHFGLPSDDDSLDEVHQECNLTNLTPTPKSYSKVIYSQQQVSLIPMVSIDRSLSSGSLAKVVPRVMPKHQSISSENDGGYDAGKSVSFMFEKEVTINGSKFEGKRKKKRDKMRGEKKDDECSTGNAVVRSHRQAKQSQTPMAEAAIPKQHVGPYPVPISVPTNSSFDRISIEQLPWVSYSVTKDAVLDQSDRVIQATECIICGLVGLNSLDLQCGASWLNYRDCIEDVDPVPHVFCVQCLREWEYERGSQRGAMAEQLQCCYCSTDTTIHSLLQCHLSKWSIQCPDCAWIGDFNRIIDHWQNDCPTANRTPCPFVNYGCCELGLHPSLKEAHCIEYRTVHEELRLNAIARDGNSEGHLSETTVPADRKTLSSGIEDLPTMDLPIIMEQMPAAVFNVNDVSDHDSRTIRQTYSLTSYSSEVSQTKTGVSAHATISDDENVSSSTSELNAMPNAISQTTTCTTLAPATAGHFGLSCTLPFVQSIRLITDERNDSCEQATLIMLSRYLGGSSTSTTCLANRRRKDTNPDRVVRIKLPCLLQIQRGRNLKYIPPKDPSQLVLLKGHGPIDESPATTYFMEADTSRLLTKHENATEAKYVMLGGALHPCHHTRLNGFRKAAHRYTNRNATPNTVITGYELAILFDVNFVTDTYSIRLLTYDSIDEI